MFSTALRHFWLALKEGVKIGERWVGYAAEECNLMTVLFDISNLEWCEDSDKEHLRVISGMKHDQSAVQALTKTSLCEQSARVAKLLWKVVFPVLNS